MRAIFGPHICGDALAGGLETEVRFSPPHFSLLEISSLGVRVYGIPSGVKLLWLKFPLSLKAWV